jgi:hypothetical protein
MQFGEVYIPKAPAHHSPPEQRIVASSAGKGMVPGSYILCLGTNLFVSAKYSLSCSCFFAAVIPGPQGVYLGNQTSDNDLNIDAQFFAY